MTTLDPYAHASTARTRLSELGLYELEDELRVIFHEYTFADLAGLRPGHLLLGKHGELWRVLPGAPLTCRVVGMPGYRFHVDADTLIRGDFRIVKTPGPAFHALLCARQRWLRNVMTLDTFPPLPPRYPLAPGR